MLLWEKPGRARDSVQPTEAEDTRVDEEDGVATWTGKMQSGRTVKEAAVWSF